MPENYLHTTSVKEKYTIDANLIKYPCTMYLDQATKCGICVYDDRKRLVTTLQIEKKKSTSIIEFRSILRVKIQELIDSYKVDKIFCEDVYGGVNFDTTAKLLSIRDLVLDIAFENSIKAFPLNNKKWKSRLAYPEAFKDTIDHKEQIKKYVKKYYPTIKFEHDVMDSVGMAIAVLFKATENLRPMEISLDKKLKIATEVKVVSGDYMEKLEEIILDSKFKNKLKTLEYNIFDYDTTLDIGTNFRYILTNFDVIAITRIPYHRYYGQILLEYDIRPSEIGDTDVIIGLAVRRY